MKKNFNKIRILVFVFFIPCILNANNIDKGNYDEVSNFSPFVKLIYKSNNLEDFSVFAECLDNERCDKCRRDDVGIKVFDNYAEVISNIYLKKIYVNAIGYKKFQEILPDGESIPDKIYIYKGKIKIPILPLADIYQYINSQAVHTMIQFYNPDSKTSYEGSIYWDLNPWINEYNLMVYSVNHDNTLFLYKTGIRVKPEIKWYNFEIIVNMKTKKYISINFDGQSIDLSHLKLAQVEHNEWGNDVSINITAESLASWPGTQCNIFKWKTHFKDLEFGYIDFSINQDE